jgi:hypothetical protein
LRAKTLASLYAANLAVCGFLILFFILALAFTDKNFIPGLAVTLAIASLLGLQLYSFYSAANVNACATFFSMTFFTLALTGVVLSGGWHSPMLLLLLCCPAISFLVGGRGEGFYMSGLVYICGMILMVAYLKNFQVFHLTSPEKNEWIQFYIWIISTMILVGCLMVYDSLLNSFRKR